MGLKRDFLDAPYWNELAKNTPYDLPAWSVPLTVDSMTNWIERFDLTPDKYERLNGITLQCFIDKNPTWPLRAFVGLLLEGN